jgi:hypothetical protein
MGPFIGLIIVATISVAVVDIGAFLAIRKNPANLTVPRLVAVIFITILPIALRAALDVWTQR